MLKRLPALWIIVGVFVVCVRAVVECTWGAQDHANPQTCLPSARPLVLNLNHHHHPTPPTRTYTHTLLSSQDQPYDWKADVWSAGCVLYELAALHRPFSGCSMPAVVVKILRGVVAPLSPVYSAPVHALASALLDRDPRTRPSMEQVRRSVSATHGSIDWLFVCHSQ